MGGRPAGLIQSAVCVLSGATGEETSDARPAEPGAGGSGDAVPLWAAGPPHQGADAAGRDDPRNSLPTLPPLLTKKHLTSGFSCNVSPQYVFHQLQSN